MEHILRFIASPTGRWVRIIGGSAVLALALTRRAPRLVIGPGLAAVLTGVFDLVPPARFFGLPVRGSALRAQLQA